MPRSRRAAPKCSACGATGHTKRSSKCPKKGSEMRVESEAVGPPRVESFLPEADRVWRHVEHPSAPLVVLRDLVEIDAAASGAEEGENVLGAYVKLAPALRPSEREGVDVAGLRASLVSRGALGVAWAPRTVAESRTEAPPPDSIDARAAIEGWIERQAGVDEGVRAAALELCLQLAEEEGV